MRRLKEHNTNNLTLHTETLRHLSTSHLAHARGGLDDGDGDWADGGGWDGFDFGDPNENFGGGLDWTFWDNQGGM